jgi:DNA (cytosine-5)-methyltransferase 1
MIYGSVCSGIEAATVAWHSLGWKPAWFSEIEKFPSEVLKYHYPLIPNLGDMTKIYETKPFKENKIDLLVGGTPCQSFSMSGLRKGLKDPRGNLALKFCQLAKALQPRWILWENVTGVLSAQKGKAFGSLLGALAKCGYGFSYRVLDAQNFGVPQRRRRVFVVGYLGDWRPSAAVLFEQESLCWSSKKSKESQQESTTSIENSIREIKLPIFADVKNYTISEQAPTLTASCGISNATGPKILDDKGVRRLTLLECERLQGFPDNYTNIPGAKDGYRYKALGNSMAIPVMHWIGKRIKYVDSIIKENNE